MIFIFRFWRWFEYFNNHYYWRNQEQNTMIFLWGNGGHLTIYYTFTLIRSKKACKPIAIFWYWDEMPSAWKWVCNNYWCPHSSSCSDSECSSGITLLGKCLVNNFLYFSNLNFIFWMFFYIFLFGIFHIILIYFLVLIKIAK